MLSWLPEGVSTYAKDIDNIFYLIYYLTSFVFLLVTVLLVVFVIKYRHQEGRRAVFSHGSAALELIWTVIPAMIFIALFFISQATWARIKGPAPPGGIQVRVWAKQFAWEFAYPGPDRRFDTDDDKTVVNELHVPVHEVVRVYLRSRDVIHSFFVPALRLKQDVVPGREIVAWFEATKPGKYEIACAELCGLGHSFMRGWLIVQTAEAYQRWVKEQWP